MFAVCVDLLNRQKIWPFELTRRTKKRRSFELARKATCFEDDSNSAHSEQHLFFFFFMFPCLCWCAWTGRVIGRSSTSRRHARKKDNKGQIARVLAAGTSSAGENSVTDRFSKSTAKRAASQTQHLIQRRSFRHRHSKHASWKTPDLPKNPVKLEQGSVDTL